MSESHVARASRQSSLKRILVFTPAYPPAFLFGGPTRSVEGIVDGLGDEFAFFVATSAYDGDAPAPLADVVVDRWYGRGKAQVWYSSKRSVPLGRIGQMMRDVRPSLVYLNSLFHPHYSIKVLLLCRVAHGKVPVLLAPRGELSPGALRFGRLKKVAVCRLLRACRLDRHVTWHVSSEDEKRNVLEVFPKAERVLVAPPLSARRPAGDMRVGSLGGNRLLYLSRIVPMKNLLTLVRSIAELSTPVELLVGGPIEDEDYWERCLDAAKWWTNGSQIRHAGPIHPSGVIDFLRSGDLFVLPTFGENYGHVVREAIEAGVPLIVGRDTPWKVVEDAGAGWLCDPEDASALARLIQGFLDVGELERAKLRAAVRKLAHVVADDGGTLAATRVVIMAAVQQQRVE